MQKPLIFGLTAFFINPSLTHPDNPGLVELVSLICLSANSGSSVPFFKIYHPSIYANISGATMVASDSIINLGVSGDNLPQVIFSFGTAPE